jgi:hypothetical protein
MIVPLVAMWLFTSPCHAQSPCQKELDKAHRLLAKHKKALSKPGTTRQPHDVVAQFKPVILQLKHQDCHTELIQLLGELKQEQLLMMTQGQSLPMRTLYPINP